MEATITCPRCEQRIAADESTCPACGHLHRDPVPCARHADRLAHGVCVVCGDPVCDECNQEDTVHFACPAHGSIPIIEGWAQVYTTSDAVEADLIKENLQSEGLGAAVLSQKDRSFNVDLGDLSSVRILVPAFEYLNAMEVLSAHMDTRGEVLFACPACGEVFESGDLACRACGAELPARVEPRPETR
jgi:uncharacterized C2H2 Zn-finger protein